MRLVKDEPQRVKAVQVVPADQHATNGSGTFKGTVLNQKKAIKLLREHGWEQTIGGSHVVKMKKPGHRPITLPKHKGQDYGKSLSAAILKQAGLS